MATMQAVLSDAQIEVELQLKARELDKLQERLRAEERKVDGARTELNRVVDAIERGATGKEAEFSRATQEVETAGIRVGGLRKLIAPIEARIKELTEEFHRRQAAAAKAAHERDFAARVEKGRALAIAIREKLMRLCIEDLPEFEELRRSLILEYVDIGGNMAAVNLLEMLLKPARGMEGLRDPQVHIAELEAKGFTRIGFQLQESFNPHAGEIVQHEIAPGKFINQSKGAVTAQLSTFLYSLTVQSMRPRE